MKIKKISIFLISGVLLFYFNFAFGCQNNSDCGDPSGLSVRCVNGKCIRPLEIAYPKIGSEQLTEEVIVKEGLPGYVKFIFNLAIGIVGLIILGNLVFSGVGYITSVGDPGKMNEAKSGILSSILGALILFSSVMVFRQINPKLVELKLEPVDLLLPPVQPGIYICEYKVDTNELETAINNYLNLNSNQETRLAAIKSLQKIIWDKEKKRGCYRVNYSGNLKFNVTSNGNTIFQIPYFSIDPNTYQSVLKWEYGIILHEKENFGGKCKIFPQEENGLIYHQINNFSATGMDFTARSVTLFQRLDSEPTGDGVILYKDPDKCQRAKPDDQKIVLKPAADKDVISLTPLSQNEVNLTNNVRSVCFSPPRNYIAVLYKDENFTGTCAQIAVDNPYVLDVVPLNLCIDKPEAWYEKVFNFIINNHILNFLLGTCSPEVSSVKVIKGIKL